MLEIKNIRKTLGNKEVLKDLNLTVNSHSIFGLVGVNGAGKSTLLRCISGVYQPESGEILLNGVNTWNYPHVRKDIAFVSDEMYYPLSASIESMKVLYQSMYNFDEIAFQKYLSMFDLDTKGQISNFSKGMKRRVSLLFALSIHPKLMLLDEAYDGLEPLARYRFKSALTDLLEDEDVTVIISSHSLKEMEDICDTYGILDQGKIVTYGDLLDSKMLMNKYQVAFEDEKTKECFKDMEILHYEKEGKVYQLVIRGNEEEITKKLNAMNPLLLDVLPVNFEELFIYEVESRGENNEKKLF